MPHRSGRAPPPLALIVRLALLACLAGGQGAQAAIYKYVDAEGNITFTDRWRPGAKRLTDGNGGPVTRVETPRASRPAAGKASPADFPRVDGDTQRKRDDMRRRILLEERAAEAKQLTDAIANRQAAAARALSAAEQTKLSESIRLHENNIKLLDKELARIK